MSSLFSTNNFTNELFIPNVAIDFDIVEKFMKLPNKAIPEAPKNTDTIFVEIIPKKKLTTTEMEFSDNTFSKVFCFKIFNIINF